jgi:hypothetical protein
MEKPAKTRITFEQSEYRYVWESEYMDEDAYAIVEAFYGLLITATFQPVSILEAMKGLVEEHKDVLRKRKSKLQ